MTAHPYLFAGFNTAPNNGDDVDGAGGNFGAPGVENGANVSPRWFESFIAYEVLIISADMLSIFADECADLVIRGGPDTVVFPSELETLVIRRAA